MLRLYLDWNCITHLKESYNKELFDYISSNKCFFVFPFSPAHFEDLQRSCPSKNKENEDYYTDLDTLHNICETHLIMFDNDKKRVLPFSATPYEYAKKSGNSDTLDDILQYNSFTEYITKEIGEPYCTIIDKQLKGMPMETNIPVFSNEVIKNGADLLNQGFNFMKEVLTRVNYNKELSAGIRVHEASSFKRISGATPNNIHKEIDKMISKTSPQYNMDKLIGLTLQNNTQKTDLTEFLSYYLSYDFMGFKQDRGHDLRNIITDAKHAYYGSYCDVGIHRGGGIERAGTEIHILVARAAQHQHEEIHLLTPAAVGALHPVLAKVGLAVLAEGKLGLLLIGTRRLLLALGDAVLQAQVRHEIEHRLAADTLQGVAVALLQAVLYLTAGETGEATQQIQHEWLVLIELVTVLTLADTAREKLFLAHAKILSHSTAVDSQLARNLAFV